MKCSLSSLLYLIAKFSAMFSIFCYGQILCHDIKRKHEVISNMSSVWYLCVCILSCSVVSNSLWCWTRSVCPATMDRSLPGSSLCSWDFPGKNTGAGHHFLLLGIFPTQGLKWSISHLLNWQADSLPLVPMICTRVHACLSRFTHVWLFATLWLKPTRLLCPWEFSKQEYWSGLLCLLQQIFATQGSNLSLMSPALAGRLFTKHLIITSLL